MRRSTRPTPFAESRAEVREARRRRRRIHRTPKPATAVVELEPTFQKLARRLHASVPGLRSSWTVDDLVQEAFLRALLTIERHEGRSTLKTYMTTVVRNHLLSMARRATHRPKPVGDVEVAAPERDADRDREIREETSKLLRWLRTNPREVRDGYEVLNLLLWNHGDYSKVATNMTIHTGNAWTTERVRNVVRRIRETERGRALCVAGGVNDDEGRI